MGWEATEPGPVEETGGYRMFHAGRTERGRADGSHAGGPAHRLGRLCVSVTDADETAAKVTPPVAGHVEPMDVMEIGRMAFFVDPGGAVFGVWQPKTFDGADLVNEPNSLCWNEC